MRPSSRPRRSGPARRRWPGTTERPRGPGEPAAAAGRAARLFDRPISASRPARTWSSKVNAQRRSKSRSAVSSWQGSPPKRDSAVEGIDRDRDPAAAALDGPCLFVVPGKVVGAAGHQERTEPPPLRLQPAEIVAFQQVEQTGPGPDPAPSPGRVPCAGRRHRGDTSSRGRAPPAPRGPRARRGRQPPGFGPSRSSGIGRLMASRTWPGPVGRRTTTGVISRAMTHSTLRHCGSDSKPFDRPQKSLRAWLGVSKP